MKKIILFATMATLFTLACNKKDSAPETPSLVHKWGLVNLNYKETENGTVIDDTNYTGTAADYVEFKTDNKVYSFVNGQNDIADYQLLQDNKVIIDGDTYEIQVLTLTSATLYSKITITANDYTEVTINLKR